MKKENQIGAEITVRKADLLNARARVRDFVRHTPVLSSSYLNSLAGAEIWFKCENFQKGGAFKIRGASNAIFSLDPSELKKGVVTHSSGNHAQAVAIAAKEKGTEAHIVMPDNSAEVKIQAVKGYGGKITYSKADLCSREDTLDLVKNRTGTTFIHPYDDDRIIAGQSTCAQEIFEEINNALDYLLAPVGGGGLLSGTALSALHFSPQTKVIGCEPELASDAHEAFRTKAWVPANEPITIADGLRTALGRRNLNIILEHVKDILLVSEQEIKNSIKLIWERMKLVVEPSAAVPLAALIRNKEMFQGKRVGVILSGGNIDLKKMGDLFS